MSVSGAQVTFWENKDEDIVLFPRYSEYRYINNYMCN